MSDTNKEKTLLIVEKSQFNLVHKKDEANTEGDKGNSNSYVFEGIFAVLGEKNKNQRIYTESQYLPQIERLQEEINQKKVWGEANHPVDRFDVNVLNVACVVEKIGYNKETRQVTGQVRLVDTTAGREIKALVNEGLPISISSRAAGSVNEQGIVQMKHLFTYDIVHNPGFHEARLNRVNEQYGLENFENVSLFEVGSNELQKALTKEPVVKKTTPVEKDLDNKPNTNKPVVEKKLDNNNIYNKKGLNMDKNDFVTEDKFSQYSNYLKEKFATYNTKLTEMEAKVNEKANKRCKKLEEDYSSLLEYANYLSNHLNKSIAHNDHIVEYVTEMKGYVGYLSENLDKNITYVKYLSENVDKNIEYSKYLAEKLNKGLNHSDSITEGVNDLQEEILNNRNYSEYLAEQVDKGLQYSEYLAEQLDTGIQYTEHVGEKVNEGINYTNYLSENINKSLAYSEYLAENISGTGIPVAANVNVNDDNYEQAISEKLDVLVESAKKQKASSAKDSSHHFLKFMDSSDVNIFYNLNEDMKKQVVDIFEKEEYYSTNDVKMIFENQINNGSEELPFVVKAMKDHHKNVWTALNEAQKTSLLEQANQYEIKSQADVDKFWDSRQIGESKVQMLTEGENIQAPTTTHQSDDMKRIEAGILSRMGK